MRLEDLKPGDVVLVHNGDYKDYFDNVEVETVERVTQTLIFINGVAFKKRGGFSRGGTFKSRRPKILISEKDYPNIETHDGFVERKHKVNKLIQEKVDKRKEMVRFIANCSEYEIDVLRYEDIEHFYNLLFPLVSKRDRNENHK